jgi:hypothetical protein
VIPNACAADAQNRKLLTRAGVAARPYTGFCEASTAQAIFIGKISIRLKKNKK